MKKRLLLSLTIAGLLGFSGTAIAADMPSPPNSLVIADTGHIGVGTPNPPSRLSVIGDSAVEEEVQVLVENANTADPGSPKNLFVIKNDGPARFSMWSSATDEWVFNARADDFRISKQGTGLVEMKLTSAGNLNITGALKQGSSRTIKQDIYAVDSQDVLKKVVALPISTWSYKHDTPSKHLGPMAEDFHQAFGLGDDPKGISSIDTGGVALAAIKGLNEAKNREITALREEKNKEINSLKEENKEFSERLTMLENLVNKLIAKEVAMNH